MSTQIGIMLGLGLVWMIGGWCIVGYAIMGTRKALENSNRAKLVLYSIIGLAVIILAILIVLSGFLLFYLGIIKLWP